VHTAVFKLLGAGGVTFEVFRSTGVTHCTDGVKSTLPRQISPSTWIYDTHISIFGNDMSVSKVMKQKVLAGKS